MCHYLMKYQRLPFPVLVLAGDGGGETTGAGGGAKETDVSTVAP